MARREWAEREVEKLCKKHQYFSEPAIALAFKTEHARTVRIVQKIKRRHSNAQEGAIYSHGFTKACEDILKALKEGRA